MRCRAFVNVLAIAGCLNVAACNLDALDEGARSLLAPEPSVFQTPGRRVVEGEYVDFRLLWGLTPTLLAHEQRDGGLVLHIASGDQGAKHDSALEPWPTCVAGPFSDYVYTGDDAGQLVVGLMNDSDQDGWGDVRFVGPTCEEWAESVANVDLQLLRESWRWREPGVLLTRGGEFSVLHGDGRRQVIAEKVSHLSIDWVRGRSRMIEDGVLVMRAIEWELFEPSVLGDASDVMVAQNDVTRALVRTAEGWIVHDSLTFGSAGLTFLGAELCPVGALARGEDLDLFYRPDCESPELRLLAVSSRGLQHLSLGSWPGVPRTPLSGTSSEDGLPADHGDFLVLGQENAPQEAGPLVHCSGQSERTIHPDWRDTTGDPVRDTPLESLSCQEVAPHAFAHPELGILLDWDGQSGTEIAEFSGDPVPLPQPGYEGWVGTRVTPGDGMVQLVHWDGASVDLARGVVADRDDVLLEGVAWTPAAERSVGSSPRSPTDRGPYSFRLGERDGVILERDGATGALHLWNPQAALRGEDDALSAAIDEQVRVGSLLSLGEELGLAYLRGSPGDAFDDPGELRVYLSRADVFQSIADGVTTYRGLEVVRGIAYLVPDGEDAGIWFSKTK